ncbi:MAG: alpha/beta hydrolase [Microbacteriaceae bacterium]
MAKPLIDSDAVMWSAPERERAGRPLLVLLHGFGSHEGDLFGLTPFLPLEPVIASVRAPHSEGYGYSWFPLAGTAHDQERRDGADATVAALLDWLDTTSATSVGLLGFSQGAATALQLLRHAPERFSYVVQLAGFAIDGTAPGDAELHRTRPPVFWGRGTLDQVIAPAFIEHTEAWLPEHSTLTARIYEDLAHGISQAELADVSSFIRATLTTGEPT